MNGNTTIARGLSTRKAFIDSSLQAEFEENGYVLIPGVLHKDSIAALSDVYDRFSPSVTAGFHVTNWIKDPAYSASSHEKIAFLLAPKLKGILNNYRPVLGCFAVKEKGRDNTMGLHQDWSLTDESAFCGISAWVPLIDVAADSGALQMLRGSHRLFRNIRGQKISNQLDRLPVGTLHQYLTSVPMKAGDMLLLHHRIVHCSGPAMHRRIAAMMAMIPEEARLKHYVADSADMTGSSIRVYDCPDDFYVHFDIDSMPDPGLESCCTRQTDFVVTEPMIVDHYSR